MLDTRGWGGGGRPRKRSEDRGRTTRVPVCSPRLGKDAPPSLLCLYDFASLVGGSGTPFLTTPIVKSSNTLRVSDNNH
ncbi:MAG: hypothetical protein LBK25_01605 [Treponema sp.]|nr:hypothetical protein [Treponema sp.]